MVSRLHTKCGTCDKLCHAAEKYAIPRSMHTSNIQATYHFVYSLRLFQIGECSLVLREPG